MVAGECSPDLTFLGKVLEFPKSLGHWPSDVSRALRRVLACLVFLVEYTFFGTLPVG